MSSQNPGIDPAAFKHLVVPLGVVIGLGVAHLVRCVASYIEKRREVRFSLGHSLWTAVCFLFLIALWWNVWALRSIPGESWSYFVLIYLMVGPAAMFLAVALLVPSLPDDPPEGTAPGLRLDLGRHMDSACRHVFSSIAGAVLWLMITQTWLEGQELLTANRFFQSSAIVLLSIGVVWPSRRIATILGVVMLLLSGIAFGLLRQQFV